MSALYPPNILCKTAVSKDGSVGLFRPKLQFYSWYSKLVSGLNVTRPASSTTRVALGHSFSYPSYTYCTTFTELFSYFSLVPFSVCITLPLTMAGERLIEAYIPCVSTLLYSLLLRHIQQAEDYTKSIQ